MAGDDLPEDNTAEFYREQAARLKRIAETETHTAQSRLELLEMAAMFQRLAEKAARA